MNILTFDIEDWFHILDNASTGSENEWQNFPSRLENFTPFLEKLKENNQQATFFCLGWIADKHPSFIKSIAEAGFEIASHSQNHQLVYQQSKSEFTEDLKRSLGNLEDLIGKKIKIYRAPGFSINASTKWAFEVLIENGIEIDCSVLPGNHSHGGFAKFEESRPCIIETSVGNLKEFPMNTANIFGKKICYTGGGYFRFFPYWLIKGLMQKSDYNITYFHPRDFDADQPMVPGLNMFRKFKSYYGLKAANNKFSNLLKDFSFESISNADKMLDWEKAKKLDLRLLQ